MPQHKEAQWRLFKDWTKIEAELSDLDLVVVHRPLHIYERRAGKAVVVEERDHLTLLFHRITGLRHLRQEVQDKAGFDRLAKAARSFYLPCTVYEKQLPFVMDRTHKVCGFFGGARGGKTHALVQRAIDTWVTKGGPGRDFWAVAPTREKTRVFVGKFLSLMPRELVTSFPDTYFRPRQVIDLADGSTVSLKFASKADAANLKGEAPLEIWADELCSIPHAENFSVMLDRLTDHCGQLAFSTTPTPGNWAKEKIFDFGRRRDEIFDETPDVVFDSITARDNPWQSPTEIDRRIRVGGGPEDPAVRREVFGEWVSDGELLWREFSVKRHLIEGHYWDCEGWGYTNINRLVWGRIFPNVASYRYVGGMDFNFYPFSIVVTQVGVKDGLDQNDPRNWVLFCLDLIQKKARSEYDFAKFVAGAQANCASRFRSLPDTTFAGMPIICDATSAYPSPVKEGRGWGDKSTARWQAMLDAGFPCEPCDYGKGGKPANPNRKDRISLMHKMFIDDRVKIHGTRCSHGPYSLVMGLETQLRAPDGTAAKKAGTVADRMSSATDAMTYLTWAGFADELQPKIEISW